MRQLLSKQKTNKAAWRPVILAGGKNRLGRQRVRQARGGKSSSLIRRISQASLNEAALDRGSRRGRVGLVAAIMVLLAVTVAGRLFYLQNVEHLKWVDLASKQQNTAVQIQGARGTVLDSAGRTLAVSVEAVSIGVHPKSLADRSEFLAKIRELSIAEEEGLSERLFSDRNFVWVAHGAAPEAGTALRQNFERAIEVYPEFRRYYPQGKTAATVLGTVGREGRGLAGIELAFDRELSAPNLRLAADRDARGRILPRVEEPKNDLILDLIEQFNFLAPKESLALDFNTPSDPMADERALRFDGGLAGGYGSYSFRREGGAVTLSIDTVIQAIIEEEFRGALERTKANRVFGVAMDAETGEILGLAQAIKDDNGFDPNVQNELSPDALRNIAIQNNFEPGSTIKPLVAALALDNKVASSEETMNCENGSYRVANKTIRDVHPVGVASFGDVLVRSSNICMAKLGQRLGKKRLHDGLRSLGFGTPTGVELQGESKGIMRDSSKWAEVDVATHSFGQGVAVTAMQMVRAYAALANGGILVTPTLLHEQRPQTADKRVFRADSAQKIAQIIRGVTENKEGTGRQAAIPGIAVSGKTGTAQKPRHKARGYDPNRILASFIGFIDGSPIGVDRTIVMMVAVDEPGVTPRWGGVVAAPVFRASMERILSHLLAAETAGQNGGVAPGAAAVAAPGLPG